MRRRAHAPIAPFAAHHRGKLAAIIVVFALSSALGIVLSVRAASGAQHRAVVVEIASRQRTLAERYVKETLLVRDGAGTDPALIGATLRRSQRALLDGGRAPALNGDDDATGVPRAGGALQRAQLRKEGRLIDDLLRVGSAVGAHRPVAGMHLTADERLAPGAPVEQLSALAALTSNVSLNAARTIAAAADRSVGHVITSQIAIGIVGLVVSLLLGFALLRTARRQSSHFVSLVQSSTDLVLVFGDGRCRYASPSVAQLLDRADAGFVGDEFADLVDPEDRPAFERACRTARPASLVIRIRPPGAAERHLDAQFTDLLRDRHVRGVVMNARDVTERVQLEEELTRQAFRDQLTGLANRALFHDRLAQALARSSRSNERFALLLLDLDSFKRVNDSLGHDVGDQLLVQVAQRFDALTRASDTLARFGGDEFAVLVDGADERRATAMADRLIESLTGPVSVAGHELPVGASIGIVVHDGGPGVAEDLLRHADLAMYAAKERGRDRHELYHEEMARGVGELLGLERELRDGLQAGEFALHYQPEIDLDTKGIVGVEALLRWTSPSRGSVPPAMFIPIAETTGMIHRLGDFVLREACRQAVEWSADGVLPPGFTMWVNVSGVQLSAGGIAAAVETTLRESGLAAGMLGLEITETAIVAEGAAERVQKDLQRLHALGVRIAIDDFGTGFSALGQLRRFPIDVIKVDRSFVQGIEHHAKDAAITANLVNLAHALGIRAIAEGVESSDQLVSLEGLGCDLAQGFLFARPAASDVIRATLVAASRDTPATVA